MEEIETIVKKTKKKKTEEKDEEERNSDDWYWPIAMFSFVHVQTSCGKPRF